MDEQENEKLSDIHSEVQGSHAQLGAINERTRNMQSHLQALSAEIESNQEDINELQSSVKRNTTVVNAATAGLAGFVIWAADKMARFLPW